MMKLFQKIMLIVLCTFYLSGCSSSYESTTQVEEGAYLQLSGNFLNGTLIIDDNLQVNLSEENTKTFELQGKLVAKFPISIGKHTIKIIKDNKVMVNRKIYVSNKNVFEVVVP